ncbi:hypothetical protein C2E21_1968 [Chlorella sorokiniana]|uniref:Uncharacterized protein n=1 Tax=Chlorella sorokiniana TaxID=3076 RepID=A0A2P6TZN8_CHLSO|nr:hypothetical protein C2E21_1968 [Chlorella sorokiniana]|eukprot:PRW59529.1 hypothetical protein C2E21_1968 [Chlorella sorokiniana]
MLRSLIRRGSAWEAGRLLLASRSGPTAAPVALLLAARQQHGQQGFEIREEAISGKVAADATSAVASSASGAGGGEAATAAAAAPAAAQAAVDGGGAAGVEAGAGETDKISVDHLSPQAFSSLADIAIGGLWTKIERGLREAGEDLSYEVRPEGSQVCVLLPYDGHLCIKKDLAQRALVVESNLFEPWQDKDEREFRPVSEMEWHDEDGATLPQFVSDALSQYLKKRVEVRM